MNRHVVSHDKNMHRLHVELDTNFYAKAVSVRACLLTKHFSSYTVFISPKSDGFYICFSCSLLSYFSSHSHTFDLRRTFRLTLLQFGKQVTDLSSPSPLYTIPIVEILLNPSQ